MSVWCVCVCVLFFFFCFQAEDGIRDLVRSRGLGDVYKRQVITAIHTGGIFDFNQEFSRRLPSG